MCLFFLGGKTWKDKLYHSWIDELADFEDMADRSLECHQVSISRFSSRLGHTHAHVCKSAQEACVDVTCQFASCALVLRTAGGFVKFLLAFKVYKDPCTPKGIFHQENATHHLSIIAPFHTIPPFPRCLRYLFMVGPQAKQGVEIDATSLKPSAVAQLTVAYDGRARRSTLAPKS